MYNILLHVCCAACLIGPLKKLREEGFEVKGYFYNPNIHPYAEYKKRKQAVKEIASLKSVEVEFEADYDIEKYFRVVNFKEDEPERCYACWLLRLKQVAKKAKEEGFEYFTTTLLVSPYQDIDMIKKIGKEVADKAGIKFHFEDFRPYFKEAHKEAEKLGLYLQNYCGCLYSERARAIKKYRKKS